MSARPEQMVAFLAGIGWADASATPLKADASDRRYYRLVRSQQSAILMDAPPDLSLKTQEFVDLTYFLRSHGLAAPEILHQDLPNGFLLLEDLGQNTFADHLTQHPEDEGPLYDAAIEVLIALATAPVPDQLDIWTPESMADIALLAWEEARVAPNEKHESKQCLTRVFSQLSNHSPVVCLRDFHAENLIWRSGRTGVDRVGLLDYQDAVTAHPIYDFVSLTRDARRDVSAGTLDRATRAYARMSDQPMDIVLRDAAIMGAQRSLRILGVFSKLARNGKPGYLRFVPRVRQHLKADLEHHALVDLRKLVNRDLAGLGNRERHHEL